MYKAILDDVIYEKGGVGEIMSVIYKEHPLTIVSSVHVELIRLMNTNQSAKNLFQVFELRCTAQLSSFHENALHTSILNAIAALKLLNSSDVDNEQRLFPLAAAALFLDVLNHNDEANELP